MMWPRFVHPEVLLLLAIVPWSIWLGMRIRSLSAMRKTTAVFLRCLILMALIAALAGAELVKNNDKLAVFFVLDESHSIPSSLRGASAETVKGMCKTFMTDKDEAGIIAFGEEASIELAIGPDLEFETVQSYVGEQQTDLAAAIRLAVAAYPQGRMRRMVLFTDGNETRGSALEEAQLAQAAGVQVNVVPLMIEGKNEVRIRQVSVPSRVNSEEPFQVRVVVTSEQDCSGTLRLYQREREGKRPLAPTEVTLRKGDNVFLLPQELDRSGFYEYEATIESNSDTVLANNEGRAFTIVYGEPTVLHVDSDPEQGIQLAQALREEGLNVVEANLGNMPTSLAQFQNFDAVVLSNISSTDLSSEQLRAIEALVRDLGVGLVMVGGPQAFGAGGFHGTPVEKALPVNMDLKQRKILPRGALVLIMHTCEIPDGNAWARSIGLASLKVLSSQDLMGAVGWMHQGEGWIYTLQPVGDKSMMKNALIGAAPGDMPQMGPTLQKAYNALKVADAAAKRIVIISDGDPAPPGRALIQALIKEGIAVSTVCIAPHSMNDQDMLKAIAQATGGEYYFVTDPKKLPQIFTKEAAVVKRGVLMEEEFSPKTHHNSELLLGFQPNSYPSLLGYVVTTPKENATLPLLTHQEDPLLAHWRYGVGKSVAFTSDATNRWATNWLDWDEFNRFWAQTVRWAMRDVVRSNFQVQTSIRDGKGQIRIDAVDDDGNFVNFLRPSGVVTGPGPDFSRQNVGLMQTGPGIYEGTFPLNNAGVYMMNLTYENPDGSTGMIPAGLALNYSREYEYTTSNLPQLERIAAAGGGKIVSPQDDPFTHNLAAAPTATPIWPYLVAFAACLFPIEIFIRRVVFDFAVPFLALLALVRKFPGLRSFLPAPKRKQRPTGGYGGMPARQFTYSGGNDGTFDADMQSRDPVLASGVAVEAVVEATQEQKPGSSEYTRKLLAAKERALQQRTKHSFRSGSQQSGQSHKENE